MDNVVWPNYAKDHAFLFENGDVQGQLKTNVLGQLSINAIPRDARANMTNCLQWAYSILESAYEPKPKN